MKKKYSRISCRKDFSHAALCLFPFQPAELTEPTLFTSCLINTLIIISQNCAFPRLSK